MEFIEFLIREDDFDMCTTTLEAIRQFPQTRALENPFMHSWGIGWAPGRAVWTHGMSNVSHAVLLDKESRELTTFLTS